MDDRKVAIKQRLEDAMLEFIERTTQEPLQEADVHILPAMIHELRELAGI